LPSRNSSDPEYAVKSRIAELERIIGKQAFQIEILKKFLSRPRGGFLGRLDEGLQLCGHGDLYRPGMASEHLLPALQAALGVRLPSPYIAGEPRLRG